MLGVTWTDPVMVISGTVEVRTRDAATGQWSRWLTLDSDSGQGERDAARGGIEPAWVGPSDGVEARVNSGGKTSARLPAWLRLDMIAPGNGSVSAKEPAALSIEESETLSSDPSDSAEPEQSPTAAPRPSLTGDRAPSCQ
ncbi:hypothetical protein ACIP6P_24705 [Streptomyces sp. NPDC088729]|uniref:hypothetical protein n=1 Tax=Streptomyces sp. NPDC088729 TaxID=3365876 RepID=UPI003815D97B